MEIVKEIIFDKIKILHISDLHFRNLDTECNQREVVLESFINFAKTLTPDIIIISGDIAYYGKNEDYQLANLWINKFLKALNILPDKLILCPGNHDINYDNISHMNIIDKKYCGIDNKEILTIENIDKLNVLYQDYCRFAENIKVKPFNTGKGDSYLYGIRNISNIYFRTLNSSWFCQLENNNVINKEIRLGIDLIEYLDTKNNLLDKKSYPNVIVTIYHHASTDLSQDEKRTYERLSSYKYLTYHSNIILNGDTHAYPDSWTQKDTAYDCPCGALFSSRTHYNNFSYIDIDIKNNKIKRTCFNFNGKEPIDKNHPENSWVEIRSAFSEGFLYANKNQKIEPLPGEIKDNLGERQQNLMNINEIEKKASNLSNIFSKIALFMLLQGSDKIKLENINNFILSNEDISIIDNKFIEFKESELRDYLVAKLLSKKNFVDIKKILFFEPDHIKVKPSFYNCIKMILKYFIDETIYKDDLLNFIKKTNPDLLISYGDEE